MNREEILNEIRDLATANGSYARLYNILTSGSDVAEDFLAKMVEQNFKDVVDMVLWLEEEPHTNERK